MHLTIKEKIINIAVKFAQVYMLIYFCSRYTTKTSFLTTLLSSLRYNPSVANTKATFSIVYVSYITIIKE